MTTPYTYKHGYPPQKYSTVPALVLDRDPTSSDLMDPKVGGYYEIPTICVNKSNGKAYVLTGISGTTATWSGITDSATGNIVGPTPASSTDNALVRWDGLTGRLVKNSTGLLTDAGILTGVRLTLPSGTAAAGTAPMKFTAGTNLTSPEAGSLEFDGTSLYYTNSTPTRRTLAIKPFSTGADATKGTVTLVAGTTAAQIATTAVAADSVIAITITALGTVTAPQAMYVTIAAGVGFDITSADMTDTSTLTWAIVG